MASHFRNDGSRFGLRGAGFNAQSFLSDEFTRNNIVDPQLQMSSETTANQVPRYVTAEKIAAPAMTGTQKARAMLRSAFASISPQSTCEMPCHTPAKSMRNDISPVFSS